MRDKHKDIRRGRNWGVGKTILWIVGAEVMALALSLALMVGLVLGSTAFIKNNRAAYADTVKSTTCNLSQGHVFYKYEYAYKTGDFSLLETEEDWVIYESIKSYLDYAYQFDTSYEQVKAIHDYMILHCEYDMERYEFKQNNMGIGPRPESQNAKGVFVNQMAVCEGYSKAFQLCMSMLGIECLSVLGTVEGGGATVNHIWNAVKLDDEWYMIDVTWDDPTPDVKGAIFYRFFNVPDWLMKQTHDYESPIEANGTKYSGNEVLWITDETDAQTVDDMLAKHLEGDGETGALRVFVQKSDGTPWAAEDVENYQLKPQNASAYTRWREWDAVNEAENVMVYTYQQNMNTSFMMEVTARLVKWVESFQ